MNHDGNTVARQSHVQFKSVCAIFRSPRERCQSVLGSESRKFRDGQ